MKPIKENWHLLHEGTIPLRSRNLGTQALSATQKNWTPQPNPHKKTNLSCTKNSKSYPLYQLSISSFLLPHSLHGSVQPTTNISWPMVAATTATMQCLYQALLKQHFLHETQHAWVMEIGAYRHPYALLVNHSSLWCNWRINEHHLQQHNIEFQHAFEIYFWCEYPTNNFIFIATMEEGGQQIYKQEIKSKLIANLQSKNVLTSRHNAVSLSWFYGTLI